LVKSLQGNGKNKNKIERKKEKKKLKRMIFEKKKIGQLKLFMVKKPSYYSNFNYEIIPYYSIFLKGFYLEVILTMIS